MTAKTRSAHRAEFSKNLKNFQKAMERELGKVPWKKLGALVIGLLILAAQYGAFGPKVALVAAMIMGQAAVA